MKKDIKENLDDFIEGVKSLHKGAYSFGDYLARISGFRDWQHERNSVMYDGMVLYIEQSKAKQETEFLWEAFKEHELLSLYIDALKNDAIDRPAYYIGSLGTGLAVGKILSSKEGVKILTGIKIAGLGSDAIHEVMEELRLQLGASEEEFFKMLKDDTLQDKIAQNIKACFDQVHCKNGVTYIINKDNKGYKLENNEWKEFDNNKEKFLTKDKNNDWEIDNTTIQKDNNQKLDTPSISKELTEFFKNKFKQDTLSEEFVECVALMQSAGNISDEQWKEFSLHPKVTEEMVEQAVKEELEKEQKELNTKNDKTKDNKNNEEDNVRRMDRQG